MESMWDIALDNSSLEELTPPDEIVSIQCAYLTEATNGKIIAKISQFRYHTEPGDDEFHFEFYLTSKLMPNYKFSIMRISHKIPYYPLTIACDDDIIEEIEDNKYRILTCNDEKHFISVLSKIINSNKINNVINSLYSIVRSHERRNGLDDVSSF